MSLSGHTKGIVYYSTTDSGLTDAIRSAGLAFPCQDSSLNSDSGTGGHCGSFATGSTSSTYGPGVDGPLAWYLGYWVGWEVTHTRNNKSHRRHWLDIAYASGIDLTSDRARVTSPASLYTAVLDSFDGAKKYQRPTQINV